jgi:hypothetical protein
MRKRKAAREKPYPDRSGKKISQEAQFRLLVEGAEQYAMLLLASWPRARIRGFPAAATARKESVCGAEIFRSISIA